MHLPEAPLCNLYTSVLNYAGHNVGKFGIDGTGPVAGLG